MKKLIFAAIAVGAVVAALGTAQAAEGCGPGAHRSFNGHCRPNGAAIAVGPFVVGTYYPNRGWWDGHRYWAHRERWHGGWRYR